MKKYFVILCAGLISLLASVAKAQEPFPVAGLDGIKDKAEASADYKIVDIRYDSGMYVSFTVHYLSVGADCVTPDTLSGVITLPSMPFMFPGLWVLDNHHTVSDNASVPSSMGNTMLGQSQVGAMAVFIATDYYGYGLTKDKVHPYLAQKQNARNSLDLLKVALDLLPAGGYMPSMLCNVGYSQGAGVAMAALELLENDEAYADVIPQFGRGVYTWCGDGPYAPMVAGKDIYDHAEHEPFPGLLPHIVNGFLCSAPAELTEGLKFSDFFTDAMAGLEDVVAAKDKTNDELSAWMVIAAGGSFKLSDFFSADMITMESPLFKKMQPWLEANSACEDWSPKNPLYLYHLVEDDIVTFANSEHAAERLGLPAEQFFAKHESEYEFSPANAKHTEFAPKFFEAFGLQAMGIYQSTSLETIESQPAEDTPCYDLQGLRVDGSYRGFIIKNGKKLLVK